MPGRRGCALATCFFALQTRQILLQLVSAPTEVRGNTSGQARWAGQLTGQTGAASAIFFGDARVRQISVGDGHESSAKECRAPWVTHQEEAPPSGQLRKWKSPSAAEMDANAARDPSRDLW